MMQSIYFLLLSIFLMPYLVVADLDLGDDFSSGATVSAANLIKVLKDKESNGTI